MSRRTRWIAAVVAVALLACVLAWWLAAEDGEEQPTLMAEPPAGALEVVPAPSIEEAGECAGGARRPFTPESVTIDDVVADAAVVGVPRDARGVTGVLPISNKVELAWDLGGIRPGSRRGNVLLNTHTWEDGSALGNALLEELHLGDRLMVEGGGSSLCYEVSMRIEVPVEEGYRPYYEEDGPPRVAIVVCSGERRPNGVWSHRTIWFARALSRA
ncbi:class F sortase [Nocardioides silvaticus]|uniref:Class F sortase n=1 Tax=Nocardioides silvaticus TaxID=2201891 RepID=A0A316TIJ7_9ACTN|nr:class F sortase [Nocardioides silvaticus]PWN02895.1 class F sortase [Nocardioides silvaticus]